MLLISISLLAFYLAWNLGANDVANSMGTSVGSGAITLRQALVIAGILELAGALLFGQNVSATLATKIVNPALFAPNPAEFIWGMIAVVMACGIWLNIATVLGLPVSSSHAVVGAIAGFGWLAAGLEAVAWKSIGMITLSWVLTPVISGAIAALFYAILQRSIIQSADALVRWQEFVPWLGAVVLATFGLLVLPTIAQGLQQVMQDKLGESWNLPVHTLVIGMEAIATFSLTWFSLRNLQLQNLQSQNLQSTAELSSAPQASIEAQLISFQILSACFVAFAHGANDVGNAIAPLAAIVFVQQTGSVPMGNFQTPLWVLLLGGVGIVAGLAVWGKKVIATIGEGIVSLQPSGGFCAQWGAATTVLLASQLGLPVSTSHAIVGGVVGVGLVQGLKAIRLNMLRDIALAWVVTIPAATGLAAGLFLIFSAIGRSAS
ncbi:MAG: inorganic phosphate transporter [Drouetiella hepatica Uher 2000/2452]|jgi:PiT family inorganic phosphate transporter|uniref:Phosphate transporter n=1 Tax=Drouetiella hepatica Uher 2000/2452 TaxID=904376 RepID=A0A951Q892_9CYAN|nr:inorganic phosphate transporter [Drouetiella hepatica Uher 2000/2452]